MQKDIYSENIKIAFKSVKSQLLKTIITAMIIAIGISCLVGMLTSVDAMKGSLNGQFALLGANTFRKKAKALSCNFLLSGYGV